MSRNAKNLTAFVGSILIMLLVVMCTIKDARATGCYKCTINNYEVTEVIEHPMTIIDGRSQNDLATGMAMSMAAGAHEMDFSTQDWQLSVTYAVQLNEEDENAMSFKLGKRWDKLGQALLHVTYVPEEQDLGEFVIFGGTVRF